MKDITLVSDLFDVEDEFFNHQLFSKLISKEHFEEVVSLMNQNKIDPYKTFQFKKVRTRETILTSLFTDAMISNNFDFIQTILKYKPATKTAIKPLMKKVDLLGMIVDDNLSEALRAIDNGKTLPIMLEAEDDPIKLMQKAYLKSSTIYNMFLKYLPDLSEDYKFFLVSFYNQDKDISSFSQKILHEPLQTFVYYHNLMKIQTNRVHSYLKNQSVIELNEEEKYFNQNYLSKFQQILHYELPHIVRDFRAEHVVYATTLSLITNNDNMYCQLFNLMNKDEFKKQEQYNEKLFAHFSNRQDLEIAKIMLEKYRLDSELFKINNLTEKKKQKFKI